VLVVRAFVRTGEFDLGLYRGGFLGLSVVTAVLIGATVHPAGHLGRVLGLRPLRWIGLRSYSIYLWHWPVYVVTRPDVDVPLRGLPLLALRLALTAVLASVSYRWVETPVRRGALGRYAAEVREAGDGRRRRLAVRWAGIVAALVLLTGSLGVAVAQATPPAPPEYLTVESTPSLLDAQGHVVAERLPSRTSATRARRERRRASSTPTTTAAPRAPAISAFGDSVMLGAAGALDARFPGEVHVDAAVARATATGIEIMRLYEAAGVLGEVVIVHLGNNGTFSDAQFEQMMEVTGRKRTVIVLNVKVPRRWEAPNNDVIYRGAKKYPNAYLLDWKKEGSKAPGGFYDDTMHLRPIGAAYYAGLVERRLDRVT
jgi:hypothetical protein